MKIWSMLALLALAATNNPTVDRGTKVDTADVTLTCERPIVLPGEPLVFRVAYRKHAGSTFEGLLNLEGGQSGLALFLAQSGSSEYHNTLRPFSAKWVYQRWPNGPDPVLNCDRQFCQLCLEPLQSLEHVDMLVVDPGKYSVKACVADENGNEYVESAPVEVEVKDSLEGDSTAGVLTLAEARRLGQFIFEAHYTGKRLSSSYTPLAERVLQSCPTSTFYDLTRYAYIMSHGRDYAGFGWPISDPAVQGMAETFLAQHPQSVLAPSVAHLLASTYAAQEDQARGLALMEQALVEWPANAELLCAIDNFRHASR